MNVIAASTNLVSPDRPTSRTSHLDELHQSWLECLATIRGQLRQRSVPDVTSALCILARLPLATSEEGVARLRLKHVLWYARAAEWGAAAFELSLLNRTALV